MIVDHFPHVDAPGMIRPCLDVPFVPYQRPLKRADVKRLAESEPFSSLPRSLIPDESTDLAPPVMHFALEMVYGALVAYAIERGVAVYYPRTKPTAIAKTALDGEATVDQGGDTGRQPKNAEVDVGASMERGLQAMVEDTARQYSLIVSFYTNYHLARDDVPKTGEIEKMCAVLGTERPPAWYVDGYKITWVPFNRK
ncbi:uncharacterized protein B0H18DRAFT_1123589 [Fomitopsis serialis]|uniref:uncharacterized protein n=1 Tax=Fomitopsis serialis TaxID=139415 RepID=UPI002007BD5B|nr:uncharacterized protein B0H18DRAFT_1123589 [Neoantrodia serialis]KAH9917507.1 hypothetical protein B0H18DRAFT_1123589 [Neoantrodia serialis]